eukprot:gnl/Hemi2/9936_TR3444_c0_g1_i1.p2 gnl/Hemi2/9936_TR3444_c0_g1~~gnl/Hemi2/9936_TR3444_c0_g1_i1.p2  ORF type:complete len:289 (+),score=70.88 gnl/Hemi2/9936_TR3444_c0_g1_i1:1213-2079(+)
MALRKEWGSRITQKDLRFIKKETELVRVQLKEHVVYVVRGALSNPEYAVHLGKRIGKGSAYGQIFECAYHGGTHSSRQYIAKLELFENASRMRDRERELDAFLRAQKLMRTCITPFELAADFDTFNAQGRKLAARLSIIISERFDNVLSDVLAKKSPVGAELMVESLAKCLEAFNRHGLYHNDTHTNNFMVKGSGANVQFGVIDWGLAQQRSFKSWGTLDSCMLLIRLLTELYYKRVRMTAAEKKFYTDLLDKYMVSRTALQGFNREDDRLFKDWLPAVKRLLGLDLF